MTPFHPFYFPFSDVQMLSLCRDCASTVWSGTFHVVGLSCSHGSGHNNLLLPPPHKPPFNSKTQQQQILRYSSRVNWRADADARTVEGSCLFKWQDHNSKWKVCEALWRKQKHSLNNFEARFRFWCGIFMIWFPRNRARKSQIWANENLGAVIMTEGFLSSLWKRWEWERGWIALQCWRVQKRHHQSAAQLTAENNKALQVVEMKQLPVARKTVAAFLPPPANYGSLPSSCLPQDGQDGARGSKQVLSRFFTSNALIQSIGPKVTGGGDPARMRGQSKTAIQQNEAPHFSFKYLVVKQSCSSPPLPPFWVWGYR